MAKKNLIVLKNMPISVLSVTLTMVTTLTAAIATVLAKNGDSVAQSYDMIDNAPEEKNVVSQSILLILSTKLTNVTMLTLTAQDTLTTLKT